MGFERSKLGDGSDSGSGNVTKAVHTHFGPRDTGKTVGITNTTGVWRDLVIDLDGAMLSAGEFPLEAPVLPAGALINEVILEVSEAFVLGGTSPALEVGTDGSEATNGVTASEAQLEAVGGYNLTSALSGTWDEVGLAAETTVGLALSGTSPTSTSAGKARLTVRYHKA